MDNTKEHQALVDDILYAVGSLPGVRCWPSRNGVAMPIGRTHPIRYGIKGESDIEGVASHKGYRACGCAHVLPLFGLYFSIEVKTGRGVLEPDQIKWQAMVKRFAGDQSHIVARSVEDALQGVKAVQFLVL